MESQLIYKVFDWLRFPLIVGVVFIHSFGKPFDYEALDIYNLSGIDCYNLFRVIDLLLAFLMEKPFRPKGGYRYEI